MDQLVIDAKTRKETGKKISKMLRAEGRLPAVMYNEKAEAVSLDVSEVQFNKVWRTITASTLVSLNVDGKVYDAFIRDTEYDIKTDKVLHADFYVVDNKKPVTASFKIQYTGNAVGVLKGGFLVKRLPVVTLKCLPKDMPVRLSIDVSEINIGDNFRVKDLNLGKKITVLTDAEASLVSVAPAR
jgi:large subunit ribosomal protein L25